MKKYFNVDFTGTQNLSLYIYNAVNGDNAKFYKNGTKVLEFDKTTHGTSFQYYDNGSNFLATDKLYLEMYMSTSSPFQCQTFLKLIEPDTRLWYGESAGHWDFDLPNHAMAFYYQLGTEEPTPSYLETLDKLDQWSSAQYMPNSGNKLNL